MELRHLRYFAAVAEAGSLTAAAERLHMSQPPLSVAIAKLEAELGVTLLERTSRGVEPTSAGRFLLDQSSRVLGEVDEMVASLGRFGAGTAGVLTLAAVPALLWHRIPTLLRAHAAAAPDVDVRLIDPPPWTAIDMLQQRRVDAAAILVADARRFASRHRGQLEVIDWGEVPLVAALPPGADDAPDPLPLATFDGATVVMPRGTAAVPSLPEAIDATFRRHGIVPGRVRTVETIQTSVPLVEAGLARAVLPDPDLASLARFGLTLRRITPEPSPLRALLLVRADARREPALDQLIRHVAGTTPSDPM
ncbi:LysR family transcriptional regulator [Demequina lignilytica]|uniref:LysR family transcriptional regulator n=1 Tax=Demequina lignilytica TaxID=3051663 RepID=A0AB35MGV9_9MICO|nr:LysR family transcriptional regulator [Demequina sp. SYSU T0a273]MDN4482993.1 LysR family transcriptional regulator [Demequina sp. SYSU T0a273]